MVPPLFPGVLTRAPSTAARRCRLAMVSALITVPLRRSLLALRPMSVAFSSGAPRSIRRSRRRRGPTAPGSLWARLTGYSSRSSPSSDVRRKVPAARMAVKVADPLFVLYDADCGLCSRTAQALRLLDGRRRLRVIPLQIAEAELGAAAPSHAAMTAALHAGRPGDGWSTGGDAALRIARAIPILRSLAVVGSLPILNRMVELGYQVLASHRDQIGRLIGAESCRFAGDTS